MKSPQFRLNHKDKPDTLNTNETLPPGDATKYVFIPRSKDFPHLRKKMLDNNLQNDPLFLRTARFASDRNADYVRKLNFQKDTVEATIAILMLTRITEYICSTATADIQNYNRDNFTATMDEISGCRLIISRAYAEKWGVSLLSPIYQTLRKLEEE